MPPFGFQPQDSADEPKSSSSMFGKVARLTKSEDSNPIPFDVAIHETLGVMVPVEQVTALVAAYSHTLGTSCEFLIEGAPDESQAQGASVASSYYIEGLLKLVQSLDAVSPEARMLLDEAPERN